MSIMLMLNPSDLIALDSAMYDGGAYCGKMVTINGNGKSIQAVVSLSFLYPESL